MLCSPDILTFARMVPKPIRWIRNILWRFRKVLEVLQKCPECPETVPVCPGRSWKLLEGHGRFRKVPDSTTHTPAPLALGGKPPRQPWPSRKGEAHQRRGNPPPSGITNSCFGRFPVGRCGKLWKAWESKLDSQTSLGCALGLLATYIKGARGEENTQVSGAPWLSLVGSCSTIRPRFRALI